MFDIFNNFFVSEVLDKTFLVSTDLIMYNADIIGHSGDITLFNSFNVFDPNDLSIILGISDKSDPNFVISKNYTCYTVNRYGFEPENFKNYVFYRDFYRPNLYFMEPRGSLNHSLIKFYK